MVLRLGNTLQQCFMNMNRLQACMVLRLGMHSIFIQEHDTLQACTVLRMGNTG